MILNQTREVQTNLTGGVEFSVSSDSAKIFSFLSNMLYKNKERSVMTELCSNALDAHKMVGKESTPIHVTLPTKFSSQFVVRDFGSGLSDDNIYKFLTKYGESSKGGSNDFIGGFGIGSKSPAAVTDTWTVNSHYDGNVTSFLIHISSTGIPSINKLFTRPSTETGLEVIVPVKNPTVWVSESVDVFEHYDVMPIFKCNQTVMPFVSSVDFKGLIKFDNKRSSYMGVYVLMNRRMYPIELSKVNANIRTSFISGSIIFPFNTSELSVSLSREDLQYDDRTIKAINTRFNDIMVAFQEEWTATVESASSVYQYKRTAGNFRNTFNVTSSLCRTLSKGSNYGHMVNFERLNNFSFEMPQSDSTVTYIADKKSKTINGHRYNFYVGKEVDYKTKQYKLTLISEKENDVAFVLRDLGPSASVSRVHHAVAQGVLPNRVILLDQAWFDKIPAEFIKKTASSLAKVPSKSRVVREKIASNVFILEGKRFVRHIIDPTKINICVTISSATSVDNIIEPFDKKFMTLLGKSVLGDNARIVAVKAGTPIPTGVFTPRQYVTDHFNILNKVVALEDIFKKDKYVSNPLSISKANLIKISTQCLNAKVLQYVVSELIRLEDISYLTQRSKYEKMLKYADLLDIKLNNPGVADLTAEFYAAYPAVEIMYFSQNDANRSTKILVDYINLTGK